MVLSTFIIGFGVGQFVMGRCPTASAAGRADRRHGSLRYREPAAIAAPTFETLLLARALQASAPATRVIATSIVRDCYAGAHGERDVARDDGVHRGARAGAVIRPGGAAADAVARHLHRADAVWRGGI